MMMFFFFTFLVFPILFGVVFDILLVIGVTIHPRVCMYDEAWSFVSFFSVFISS